MSLSHGRLKAAGGLGKGRGKLGGSRDAVGQEFDLTVVMLDEGGAILDPVTTVIISLGPDLPNDRAVDVSAENALDIKALGVTNDRVFVGPDKTDRVFYPRLNGFA